MTWLNDQLLKMKWLEEGIGWLITRIFNLNTENPVYSVIVFFFYDVIKIFILLSILIFITAWIQTYFTPEKTKEALGKWKGWKGNLLGAILGTLTPFCSCSSIPIFIGFTNAGLPIGVTFSFLISSPLVDLASIVLLASVFNWKIALAYVVVGILLATIGGSLIQALKLEKYVEPFVFQKPAFDLETVEEEKLTFRRRAQLAGQQVKAIIKRVWIYVLVGVGIGAIIHGIIPQEWIEVVLGSKNPFSVILATILGIPMYADIFGTLPIAEALVGKGVGIGTVLAFMMAVTALSLPSLILLKRVVKTKLLIIFVGIVSVGIIIMGYVFNWFSYLFI